MIKLTSSLASFAFLTAPLLAGTLTSSPGFGGGFINLQNLFGDRNVSNVGQVFDQAPMAPLHLQWIQLGSSFNIGRQCEAITPLSPGIARDCGDFQSGVHTLLTWLGGDDFNFAVANDSNPIERLALEASGPPGPNSALDFLFDRSEFDIHTISSPVDGTAFFGNRAIIKNILHQNLLASVEVDFATPLMPGQSVTFSADMDRCTHLPEPATVLLSGFGLAAVFLLKRKLITRA